MNRSSSIAVKYPSICVFQKRPTCTSIVGALHGPFHSLSVKNQHKRWLAVCSSPGLFLQAFRSHPPYLHAKMRTQGARLAPCSARANEIEEKRHWIFPYPISLKFGGLNASFFQSETFRILRSTSESETLGIAVRENRDWHQVGIWKLPVTHITGVAMQGLVLSYKLRQCRPPDYEWLIVFWLWRPSVYQRLRKWLPCNGLVDQEDSTSVLSVYGN